MAPRALAVLGWIAVAALAAGGAKKKKLAPHFVVVQQQYHQVSKGGSPKLIAASLKDVAMAAVATKDDRTKQAARANLKRCLRHPVIIKNLRIVPSPTFQEIRLANVEFMGGGVRCSVGQPVRGRIIVENAGFDLDTAFDVALRGGEVRILNAMFRAPVRIAGVPAPGKRCSLRVNIIGCYYKRSGHGSHTHMGRSGFVGGLFVAGAKKAVIRDNRLAGERSEFIDCAILTFDGNKVDSDELSFRQTRAGGFRRTKLQKCDIYSRQVFFSAPRAKKMERVPADKCWFHGLAKPVEIQRQVIHTDGVQVVFRKIHTRPLGLAGLPRN